MRRLHLEAFGDHGSVVADFVDELRQSVTTGDGLPLVAEEAVEVVGHVMLTPSLLDAPRRLVDVQVLSPLAVRPDRQDLGIGSRLVNTGVQMLAERAVPVVFVEGGRAAHPATSIRSESVGRRQPGRPAPGSCCGSRSSCASGGFRGVVGGTFAAEDAVQVVVEGRQCGGGLVGIEQGADHEPVSEGEQRGRLAFGIE